MPDKYVANSRSDSGRSDSLLNVVAQVVGATTTGRNTEFFLPDHTGQLIRHLHAGISFIGRLTRIGIAEAKANSFGFSEPRN